MTKWWQNFHFGQIIPLTRWIKRVRAMVSDEVSLSRWSEISQRFYRSKFSLLPKQRLKRDRASVTITLSRVSVTSDLSEGKMAPHWKRHRSPFFLHWIHDHVCDLESQRAFWRAIPLVLNRWVLLIICSTTLNHWDILYRFSFSHTSLDSG